MAWDSLRFINRDRNLNFFEKGDVHNKSLNKINLVFYRNLDILANISKITSLTLICYFIFQKYNQQFTYQHYVHENLDALKIFIAR